MGVSTCRGEARLEETLERRPDPALPQLERWATSLSGSPGYTVAREPGSLVIGMSGGRQVRQLLLTPVAVATPASARIRPYQISAKEYK